MARAFKRGDAIKHWFASVLVNLVLPVLPLGVEFALNETISHSNLVLAASMYALTTGVLSKSTLIFLISLVIGIFYSAIFGSLVKSGAVQDSYYGANVVLALLFLTNLVLKFHYHYMQRKPYTDIYLGGK